MSNKMKFKFPFGLGEGEAEGLYGIAALLIVVLVAALVLHWPF
jgi:hypothetical protein